MPRLYVDPSSDDYIVETATEGAQLLAEKLNQISPVAGADTQVQFNDGGALGGDADFTFDKTTAKLSVATTEIHGDAGYMQFETSPTPPSHTEGGVYWDAGEHTLALMTDVAGTVIQVGQENLVKVRNQTGSLIANGTPVFVSGAASGFPLVTPSDADLPSSRETIGLVTSSAGIANNTEGYVCVVGKVRDLDTTGTPVGEVWAAGDPLYVSQTTGQLTKTAPLAPAFEVLVGYVLIVHASTGSIIVGVSATAAGSTLSGLSDVALTLPAQGEMLYYDAGGGAVWRNAVNLTYTTTSLSLAGAGSQFLGVDGTSTVPTYSFTNTPDTGMYYDSGNNAVALQAEDGAGWRLLVGDSTSQRITFEYGGSQGILVEPDNFWLTDTGMEAKIAFSQRATVGTETDGDGRIWVRNDSPTTLIYSDSASNDRAVLTSPDAAPILSTQVAFGNTNDILEGSANFTYDPTLATGGLTIANTTATTSTTTGALIVTGGVAVGDNLYVDDKSVLGQGTLDESSGILEVSGGTVQPRVSVFEARSNAGGVTRTAITAISRPQGGANSTYYGVEGRAGGVGSSNGTHTGVWGRGISPTTDATNIGVRGTATTTAGGTSINYGVYGEASGATTNWAGYFSGDVNITGKLTVAGLIDPTGLELDPVSANPGGVAANTLWINSSSGELYLGDTPVGGAGGGGATVERIWQYDNTTTAGDPGSGQFRLNNTTIASATNLYIDDEDENGVDVQALLGLLEVGDAFFFSNVGDSNESARASITNISEQTGYWDFTITVELVGAATTWTDGEKFSIFLNYGASEAAAGNDTEVQFNSGGAFAASANLTFDSATSTGGLSVGNTTNSTSTATGSITTSGGVGIAKTVFVGEYVIAPASADLTETWFGFVNSATNSGMWGDSNNVGLTSAGNGVFEGNSTAQITSVYCANGGTALQLRNTYAEFPTGTPVQMLNTTASTSTTTGALIVSGGVGVAGDMYVGGTGGGSYDFAATGDKFGLVDPGDANQYVLIDAPGQNGAGTTGGLRFRQSSASGRALYMTGNDTGFYFKTTSYSSSFGELQISPDQVGIGGELRFAPDDTRAVRNSDNATMAIQSTAAPGGMTAAADTDGGDTYLTTQTGGAHTAANPRGGDLVFSAGAGGSGGTGRAGKFWFKGLVEFDAGLRVSRNDVDLTSSAVTLIAGADFAVKVDVASATYDLNLWASPVDGDYILIRNKDGGGQALTINGNGNNIEGSGTYSVSDGDSVLLIYDTEWTVY